MSMSQLETYWVTVPDWITPDLLAGSHSFLDPEEQQTYDRYRVDFKKIEFLTGRVLLKKLLSCKLKLPPEEIRFVRNDYGKLFLKTDHAPQLFFNLTHTDRLVACVFSSRDGVGIDMERIRRAPFEVMNQVFLQSEMDWVQSQPNPEMKERAFFLLWTRKEAVMKAVGLGFSLPPKTFTVPRIWEEVTDHRYKYFTSRLSLPESDALCSVVLAHPKPAESHGVSCSFQRLTVEQLYGLGRG